MNTLLQDLKYGGRMLRKHPAYTSVAVLTLALGIGANTAIFSLVNATLLRRLPVVQLENLVYVFSGTPGNNFSYPDFSEMRDQNQVFESMIAWGGITASMNSEGETEGADIVSGAIVTGNYFEGLGVRAKLGRVISPEDDRSPGAHPVAVISHRLWQSRFGGRSDVIGEQLRLNGQNFSIIGVVPAEFGGSQQGVTRDLYVPMMMQAVMRPPRAGYSGEMDPDLLKVRGNRWLGSIGRLKHGVTSEQAQAALAVIAKQQEEAFPNTNRNRSVSVSAVNDGDPQRRGQFISVATLLMSVVAAVLLIACANVANLLLARASARRKEIALRMALGASRGRLFRQLMTESALLAVMGGGAGLLLAWWLVEALKGATPPAGLPVTPEFALDVRVLIFTLALSLATGIVFGLAPALRASRPNLVPALKDESLVLDERTRRFSLRNILVVAQVAVSLVLLIAAGLFLRSLQQAQAVSPGFDAEKLLTVPLNINLLRYSRPQGREFYRQVVERAESLAGVESASVARIVPLGGGGSVRSLLIEGQAGPDDSSRSEGAGAIGDSLNSVSSNVIGLKYFQTMGIPLLRGRDFDAQDSEDRPRVVIVNEAFVRRHFGDQEAIHHRLSFNGQQGPWHQIVGIVRDSKYWSLGEASVTVAYLPLQQNHETGMTLHVRTSVDPMVLAGTVRHEIQSLEKNLPVTGIRPMTEWLSTSLYAARMGALLLGAFGALALLLASVGLYGLMSFSVSRRTRELGIRVALGAQAGELFRMVLKEGAMLVSIGVVFGLTLALIASRLLASFLFGISPTDWMTIASIPVILALVSFLACYLPARRATNVDPMAALRSE